MKRLFAAAFVLAWGLLIPICAGDTTVNPAVKKLVRNTPRHKEILKRIEMSKGEGDVIFLGDSITEGWERDGKAAWEQYFGDFKPINLGISADQTGHVLWRLTDGKELVNLDPKAAVILIGTNNAGGNDTGGHTAEQTAGGIKAIVEELRRQKPDMKILVLGLFPRGKRDDAVRITKIIPADKLNKKIPAINAVIAGLDNGKTVFYKDIGKKFLTRDGGLSAEIMPDYLHLSPKGYDIWGRAIKGDIENMVK